MYRFTYNSHVSNPYPMGWQARGQIPINVFAIDCMKYADVHRKTIFLIPTSVGWGSSTKKDWKSFKSACVFMFMQSQTKIFLALEAPFYTHRMGTRNMLVLYPPIQRGLWKAPKSFANLYIRQKNAARSIYSSFRNIY